jgi:decaprenylphospho-beta-D-ribofuranose 2-oxidase
VVVQSILRGMNRRLYGWNKVVSGEASILEPTSRLEDIFLVGPTIPRGGGQSYGDASLNFSGYVLDTGIALERDIQYFEDSVIVSASIKVKELCSQLHSKNRFLETVPGSDEATIGGCIASDVHGKNDHLYGSFGHSVLRVEICDQNGKRWVTPEESCFRYIVAGYGLTGVITRAEIRTRTIQGPAILTRITKTFGMKNLFMELSRQVRDNEYVVGWLDLSSSFKKEPRGYVECGNWANVERYPKSNQKKVRIPSIRFNVITPFTIKLFNSLTFNSLKTKYFSIKNYEDFLFPTRKIINWNNLFGESGFYEIQVLVSDETLDQFISVLDEIRSDYPIFLVGIKRTEQNGLGILSFTSKGWSVAINIPGKYIKNHDVLDLQNNIFAKCKARQYLTKDATLDKELFLKMYPMAVDFQKHRIQESHNFFMESEMSKRLDI